MLVCANCNKHSHKIAYSRHKKGSSGHGGEWNLKAPIHKKTQRPNLHTFKSKKYCTQCLRIVKKDFMIAMSKPATSVAVAV